MTGVVASTRMRVISTSRGCVRQESSRSKLGRSGAAVGAASPPAVATRTHVSIGHVAHGLRDEGSDPQPVPGGLEASQDFDQCCGFAVQSPVSKNEHR